MGNRTGDGLLLLVWLPLRQQRLSRDADGRRSKGHIPFGQPIDLSGTHSTGGKNLPGPHVIEARQHAPDGVIIQGRRRDRLAQQERRILGSKELVQAIQGTAATEGSEAHPKHQRPWIDPPLGRHHRMKRFNQADLVRIGFHNGQMLDLGSFDGR
jgi:hypothetical protein